MTDVDITAELFDLAADRGEQVEVAGLDTAFDVKTPDRSESRVSKHERHKAMLAEHAEEKIRRRERHRSGRRAYIPIHLI